MSARMFSKSARGFRSGLFQAGLLASTALVHSTMVLAQSLPTGGQVAAGSALIGTPSAGALTVTQTSGSAVVNWQSFDVGKGNRVTFVQPDANAAILNRVTGQTNSTISGQINANGQVYLINPNGIAITKTGTVKAGAFVASTLGISDDDFMGGKRSFSGNGASAPVTNAGAITINRGGYMALIGGTVANSGVITVPMGKAALGSGEQATLDLSGDGFLQVAVPTKAGGSQALVSNGGKISARGGTVQLTAAAAKDMARQAVNMSGTIEAKGVSGRSGDIVLSGGDGEVAISGNVDASSRRGTGGKVQVTGRKITLANAKINASGKTGGGTVRIGGNRQGKGPLQHAQTLDVDANTVIHADAITAGNGGNVVLWSDDLTRFAGTITAKGGAVSGNGGEVEVSGKAKLSYIGLTDLTAAHGSFGNLLLDPYNVTISTATDSNTSGFTASGNDSIINVNTLTNALATANVTVTTGSSSDATNPQAGTITVAAPINWSALTTLTLAAASDININNTITANGGLIVSSGGTISAPAAVNVGAFVLAAGNWVQNSATLPAFSAKDFRITGGASFLRVTGGDGTSATPYTVADVYGLQGIGSRGANLAANWILANDIDASGAAIWNNGAGFVPIGNSATGFEGTFDGNGHTITGLVINRPSANFVGLFGDTNSGASIANIGLVGGSITGNSYIGALVGFNDHGSISNVYATGAVSGSLSAGGVVGNNSGGIITNAYATGRVSGSSITGGLVGFNSGTMSNVHATGTVSGSLYVGGLVGMGSSGIITNAYATGAVSGIVYVGGLAGQNFYGTISNAYASGAVSGTAGNVGGFVGYNFGSGIITNSFWDTETTGQSSGAGTNLGTLSVTGLTTAQARNPSSYSGWDFANTWYQSGDMRPILRSEAATADANGVVTISNLHQLALMGANLAGSYRLTGNIDASATAGTNAADVWSTSGWVPVGDDYTQFRGTFDGNGHTISGLTVSLAESQSDNSHYPGSPTLAGLFGGILGGSVSNVGLVGGSISGGYAGALAGVSVSTIINAYAIGVTVRAGAGKAGGLVGINEGTITNSYATGSVSGVNSSVGGLVGSNHSQGSITNSYASGSVSGTGSLGGLTGDNYGTITTSFWDMDTTGQSSACGSCGGIVSATGLTTGQARDSSSYAGWDFANTWYQAGDMRPILRSEAAANGVITNLHQLALIGANLNGNYTLANNIDASETSGTNASGIWSTNGWVPLGNSNTRFAGILDGNNHTISALTVTGNDDVGLFGESSGSISNVGLVGGSVRGVNLYVGALVGFNIGSIRNSYSTAAVSGGGLVGGLVGRNYFGRISNSYASGAVSGSQEVGGLVGENYSGRISNSYASGAVSGFQLIGGLVGYDQGGTISNAYATGLVGGSSDIGGLVGATESGSNITNSFWDIDTTGQPSGNGRNLGTFSATGLTTAQMADPFSFIDAGWDLANVWGKSTSGANGGYMMLRSLSSGLYDDYVKIGNGTRSYGDANSAITGATLSGVGTGNVSLAWGSAITGTTNAGTYNYSDPDIVSVTENGPRTAYIDYSGALTISQRVLSLTGSRTYDGTTNVAVGNLSLGNLANGETLTLTGVGSMADKNAGTGKVLSVGTLALGNSINGDGGLASNYTLIGGTDTVDIAKATISDITGITAINRTYDGTTNAALNTAGAVFNGMIAGDILTVSGGTGAFADKNVGTGKTVSISSLSLGGTDAGNYTLTSDTATATANITKATISAITGITVGNKTYDGTTNVALNTAGAGFTGMAAGDALTVATSGGAFANKNAGTGKTVNISGLTLGGADVGNYTLASDTATTTADIAKATISDITGITANNKTYNGNTTAVLNTSGAGFTGMIAGDALTVATSTGTFSDKNAGTGKTVSISRLSLGGTDADNYTLTSDTATTTADIAKAYVFFGGTSVNTKVYDGTTAATVNIYTMPFSGDDMHVGYTSANFSDKNAGMSKTVSINGLYITGADANNYQLGITSTTSYGTITPAIITSIGGITAGNKTYDGTTDTRLDTSGAVFNGLIAGDSLTVGTALGAFSDQNVGAGKRVNISSLTLGGGDARNYRLDTNTATTLADIGQRVINLSGSRTYNGSTDLDASIFTLSNLVGGETLALSGTGTMADKNAGSRKGVTFASLALGDGTNGGLASNYTLAGGTDTVDIAKAVISSIGGITANGKTYNGMTDATLNTGRAVFNGMVSGDTLSLGNGFSGTFSDKNAGTGKTVTISGLSLAGADAGNYMLTADTATTLADIGQRAISVTADAASRAYGDANPVFTYSVAGSGLVNGDTLSGALTTLADQHSTVGTYGITQGTLGNPNYAISYTGADLTVSRRAITVAANNQSRAYGDANPTLTYAIGGAGLVNGDALSGLLATSATGISNVDTYRITQGTLAASGNYDLSFTAADLTVNKRAITVAANNQSRVYGDANPALTYTIGGAGLVNNDSLTGGLTTLATTASGVGNHAITQGTLAAFGNYDLTFIGGNLLVTPRALAVAANRASRTYGDANPVFGYTVSGLINGDTLTGSLASSAATGSGIGTYAIGLGTLGNGNYAINYTGANLTVMPRAITVTANNASRFSGVANPLFTYTIGGAGLVNGDGLSGVLATTADRSSAPGSYAITQGTLAASVNYDLSFVGGVLTVTAAPANPTMELASVNTPRSFAPDTPSLPPVEGQSGPPTFASGGTGSPYIVDPRFDGTVVCLGDGAGCVVQPAP
ncbi:Filamentous hemagglutinin outer membrane protein [Rhizobium freirei PRF 81]|uniref:Filamentous hemagglutinin outer membrane protein n=1 Tax=Rhizobium freirei PRF 81 TaxID=363754 RepID=N6U7I0_9HYPH|nr:YDG domain-containing protein [Rhizobium freirei]ENN88534.1 Filamentous hemagglutinin outer membrane protein [Rhizobium freirei PRF 81]